MKEQERVQPKALFKTVERGGMLGATRWIEWVTSTVFGARPRCNRAKTNCIGVQVINEEVCREGNEGVKKVAEKCSEIQKKISQTIGAREFGDATIPAGSGMGSRVVRRITW